MANKTMKTLTMGDNTYEVMDEFARSEIDSLKTGIKKGINVTLLASGWTGDSIPYTYNVTIDNHNNSIDLVELVVGDDITTDQIIALQAANIVRAEWKDNTTLVLYAYGVKPEIDALVKIFINTTIKNVVAE